MNKKLNKIISVSAAFITMLIGTIVIISWFTDNDFLSMIIPGQLKMKFNGALGFVFSSIVLLLYLLQEKNKMRTSVSVLLSVIISLIGLLTLIEYIFGFNLGIDELFVRDELRTTAIYYAGRMSPISAINFLLIGVGLLLLNKEKTAAYQFFYLFGIAFISLLMLIGFNFISDIPTFIRLTIHVAVGFITLSAAIWFAQPILQKKISFERKLFTGFFAVIILIAVLSIFSSYYSDKRILTSDLVQHTSNVLGEVEQTLSLTNDIESIGRGYIITGDSDYLEYFRSAKHNIFNHIKKLKELTKDNPSHQVRIDSLSALIDKRISFSLQCIHARKEKGFEAASEMMATPQGKFYTDKIRNITSEIQQEENNLLIQQKKENENSIVSFNRAFYVFLISILILLVIILFSIRNNISVRKKAEKQRRESEEEIQTIFNAAPDAVIVIDNKDRIVKWNPKAETLFGWTADEVLGKPLSETIIPHRYRNAHDIGMKHFFETGKGPVIGTTIEIQALNKNNVEFDVALSISPTIVQDKHLFIGFVRDVTERKIAEEKLLKLSEELEEKVLERTEEINRSEKRYRYLFKNNPMPMWVIDLNTFKFLDVNEMTILQYGYSREEFLSMTTLDIRPDEDKELFKRSDHLFEMNSTNYNKTIWNHRKKNGTIIQVEVIAHKIIFEGVPARFVLSNDVTEKKKAEEKLDKSEKLFRAMIEKDADMKTLATPEGKVFYASPSITKILGYENQELITTPAFELIHPDDVRYLIEGVTDIIQTPGKSFYHQQRVKHKNGTWLWCEGTLTNMLHEPAVAALVSNFRDITERKKFEEAQALFASIVSSSDDAILSKTLDGIVTSWNHGAEKAFGYSSNEIIGKHISILIPPLLQNEENEIMEKILKGESVDQYETERIKKDGKVLYVSLTISPIKDSNGNITGASKILRDISQRKKAEELLRLAEANYREIFDKASDAIYVHEIETGKVIEVNHRAYEITGYTREELLNSGPQEFITENPNYTLQHAMNYLQRAAAGEPQLFEWLNKNKDGSLNWLEVNLKKATIAGQERILAFFREINDRKKTQLEIQKLNEGLEQKVINRTAELQKSNELLSSLFNLNPGAIVISRLSDDKFINVNDAFLSLFGFSHKEEVIGKTAAELSIVGFYEKREEITQLLKENRFVKDFEIKTYTRQGDVFWISTSILIIEIENSPCLFSISVDISNRKKAEEQLKSVNKELEAFSYSVSHDLRAPLRAVSGYANLLEEDYKKVFDKEGNRLLGVIQENAKKMGVLIDDLLAFSRLGKKEVNGSFINMTQLTENIFFEINKTSRNKAKVKINALYPVVADYALINQVMMNLISNAIKYSSGTEKSSIQIKSEKKDGELIYSVSDNGAGFDMQYAHKLFGVFQRLHSAEEFEGTGVGLAIVKRIINKHNGRVWAEGEPGKGATFYFSLPDYETIKNN